MVVVAVGDKFLSWEDIEAFSESDDNNANS